MLDHQEPPVAPLPVMAPGMAQGKVDRNHCSGDTEQFLGPFQLAHDQKD